MTGNDDSRFYETVPRFERFAGVADPANYAPLPDSWSLATADIVSSTKAIEAGKYKAVNMAGASVIAAIINALGHRNIPFVFGGDGALLAVPSEAVAKTREALSAVKVWVKDELDLDLRAAIVSMRDIRSQGHDVRVARFQVTPELSYAMFTGGGGAWAEAEMKAGRYGIQAAVPGTRPDLSGLSCRWEPIPANNGVIVSIIVAPATGADQGDFQRLVSEVLALIGEETRDGHPVLADAMKFHFPPTGADYEARAASSGWRRPLRKLRIYAESLLGVVLFGKRLKFGSFDAKAYINDVVRNTDFRKFDDGLKLTVDVPQSLLDRIEAKLATAYRAGLCRYGLHRQDSALMTCFVPSLLASDHIHFIDGAAGGYAKAAQHMKAAA
ncbi:MAG: DUF3095 domain-containing protein [Parvibaculaceae bacterium]